MNLLVYFLYFFVPYINVCFNGYVLLGERHGITLLHMIVNILMVKRAVLEIFLVMFFNKAGF